jgi:hypothetical protein
MTYVPNPGNVDDAYRTLREWVGPDAHRGIAAVALSVNPDMVSLSRQTRMAVLARFDPEPEPNVPGLDWVPRVCEDPAGEADLVRIAERLRGL